MPEDTLPPQPPNDAALPPPPGDGGHRSPVNIEDEMRKSYLDYSMSVIIGRALPDVRDGLKPVHRRVLFAMHDLGNCPQPRLQEVRPRGGRRASASTTRTATRRSTTRMVRLAQPWSLRYLLVDGQGNFGSVDGDSPAAMRYTEVRMDRLAEELLADIDKETVDFGPNYDDSLNEPLVLPAKFPNLLVNGSAGIAVGMTTNIPPHNMGEVIDGTLHLIDNPKATVRELMKFIPGPDFPTAGFITGPRGHPPRLRDGPRPDHPARAHGDRGPPRRPSARHHRHGDSLPGEQGAAHREDRRAGAGEEARGHQRHPRRVRPRRACASSSSSSATRSPQVVLNNLFAHTPMQTDLRRGDAGHRRRPAAHADAQGDARAVHRAPPRRGHPPQPLRAAQGAERACTSSRACSVAQDLIDLVVSLIRASQDPDEARWGLMHILRRALRARALRDLPRLDYAKAKAQMERWCARAPRSPATPAWPQVRGRGFSEEQAKNILEMRLQRLTGLQREELFKELMAHPRDRRLRDILANETACSTSSRRSCRRSASATRDKRRTEITGDGDELDQRGPHRRGGHGRHRCRTPAT